MAESIGRYEVLETLGKGGMGVVYRAHDPELHREVAIKVVLSWAQYDADAMARFNREARVVAQLKHPHIVVVFDAGRTEDGLPYFVMELLEGTDLGEVLKSDGALPPPRALRYLLQICDGLTYAHDSNIVHRDIKPANLLLTPDDQVKIVDFGIAKLIGARITGSGVSLGTPLYMAPEQLAGQQVDWRADIFALGGVLYTLLAGQAPFEAPTLGRICNKIESEDPPPLKELGIAVPADLEAVATRALEKDREQRYQSVAAMADDIKAVMATLEASVDPTVITPRPVMAGAATGDETLSEPSGRRRVALLAVAVIALAAAVWVWPNVKTQDGAELSGGEHTEQIDLDDGDGNGSEPTPNVEDQQPAEDVEEKVEPPPDEELDVDPTPDEVTDGDDEGKPIFNIRPPLGELAGEEVTLYPAGNIERSRVNGKVSLLLRAIEAQDREAVARAFGGQMNMRQRQMLQRLLNGPRTRIRHTILDVLSAEDGSMVVAEVGYDILFVGSPDQVPPPRTGVWAVIFDSDERGRLHLRAMRPR